MGFVGDKIDRLTGDFEVPGKIRLSKITELLVTDFLRSGLQQIHPFDELG